MKISIYEPDQRRKLTVVSSFFIMFRNILDSRDLAYQLFKRDFFAVYKKSLFGISWLVISPIIGVVSWVLMNATGVFIPGKVSMPYPVYVLLGTMFWGLFMSFFQAGVETLRAGSGFINLIKFPHEVLLVKQTAQQLANFSISFVLNLFVLTLFGITPSWRVIFLPVVIMPLFFIGASVGLVISVFSAAAFDISKVVSIFLGLIMYVTPVVFSPVTGGVIFRKVMAWNPLTYIIVNCRNIMISGSFWEFETFVFVWFLSCFLFMFSWRLFYLSESTVIEKLY